MVMSLSFARLFNHPDAQQSSPHQSRNKMIICFKRINCPPGPSAGIGVKSRRGVQDLGNRDSWMRI